jgi:hypothetical protein
MVGGADVKELEQIVTPATSLTCAAVSQTLGFERDVPLQPQLARAEQDGRGCDMRNRWMKAPPLGSVCCA